MSGTRTRLLALGLSAAAIAAGCGSSNKSSTGGTTYTLGVLTDITGAAASGNKSSVQGVEAGIHRAATEGIHIRMVTGDTQTSPAAALSAGTELVQEDHVSAVVAVSALTFGAANYFTSHGVPVVGANIDGTEWLTAKNMFSVFGFVDESKVTTGIGKFMKMEGGTVVGTLGYGISPSSSESAKATADSAQEAGLKIGYVNPNFQFGSTNVEPIALAMKAAGVNAVFSSTDPNTSFALVTALKQLGADLKVEDFPDGYGGDLTQAGPGAVRAAQGAAFSLAFEPVEMHTAATRQFQADLAAVGVNGEPTSAEYEGYAAVAAFVDAIKAAPKNPTYAQLITALAGVKNYTAAGLLGSQGFDLNDRAGTAAGVHGCGYYAELSGSGFKLIPGADPLCGSVVAGKTVSPGA